MTTRQAQFICSGHRNQMEIIFGPKLTILAKNQKFNSSLLFRQPPILKLQKLKWRVKPQANGPNILDNFIFLPRKPNQAIFELKILKNLPLHNLPKLLHLWIDLRISARNDQIAPKTSENHFIMHKNIKNYWLQAKLVKKKFHWPKIHHSSFKIH